MSTVKRGAFVVVFVSAMLAASARPARAQQTLNFSWGYFMVQTQGRVDSDILLVEHHDLAFKIRDFSGVSLGGEWLVPLGHLFEAGAGVSFSSRTVSAVHVRAFNPDGTAVPRSLGLRQLPVTFTGRVLPLGQAYRVQPYVGGGVAVIPWEFRESGDFASPGGTIFRGERYTASGLAIGPVVLFGLRVSGDTLALGLEGRYQKARGSFGPAFARVVGPDLDLDGWTIASTIGLRFGPL